MKRKAMWMLATFVLVVLVAGSAWLAMYPSASDPKNIRYVLWKVGLPTIDFDKAAGTMIGDPNRDRLVLGKTEDELRRRFGRLLGPNEISPYLGNCYLISGWKGRDVRFIRTSPWMVVFEKGIATKLVLLKGC